MAGEMLRRAQNPGLLHPARHQAGLTAHAQRILPERAVPDDRVVRVDIHVEHRGEIHMHPHPGQVGTYLLPDLHQYRAVLYGAQGGVPWKGVGRIQAHRQAPFGVHGDQQGDAGRFLQCIGKPCLGQDIPSGENDTANPVVCNKLP